MQRTARTFDRTARPMLRATALAAMTATMLACGGGTPTEAASSDATGAAAA